MNRTILKKTAIKDVAVAISEDLGSGDLTTNLLGKDKNKLSLAIVKSNENAVLCGQIWFDNSFKNIQKKYGGSLKISWLKKDGDKIKKGDVICKIKAPLRTILISERTALNFLQLLSGTASITKLYSDKIKNKKIKLLDTRKTIPGLRIAQKYAVKCGGGYNHRFGLYDEVLIKENHITEKLFSFDDFLKKIYKNINFKKVSIEVENLKELEILIKYKPKNILLDNFTLSDIKKAIKIINKKISSIEVSGGINVKNIEKYAKLDINYISIGSLTKNVCSVDFSMLVNK
ncbi:MAG: nicotinate-nucleotide diphosphorylase (carboxylating) [Gammaproteobacteria bacterium]|nr:nicotinate-nucleotide diphosphorylase (carboxylating) [Gammaproteobacteria bacterium]